MSPSNKFKGFSFPSILAAAIGLCSAAPAIANTTFYSLATPSANNKFQIYSININGSMVTYNPLIVDNGSTTCGATCASARVNGFSYDSVNSNFFFFDSNSSSPKIYYAPVTSSSTTTTIDSVQGMMPRNFNVLNNLNLTGATFYQDAIYAVANENTTLFKIPISTVNGVASFAGDVKTYSNLPFGGSGTGIFYGDIVVRNGVLYGYTTGATDSTRAFYSYNLSTETGQVITNNGLPQGVQISNASTDSSSPIYGIDRDGKWYTILEDGTQTQFATAQTPYSTTMPDLAGANPAVPAPLPLFGAAVAFRASRRIRNRVKMTNQLGPEAFTA